MANLIQYIEKNIDISDALKEALSKIAVTVSFKKGTNVTMPGERCSDLIFVEKGLLRGYYYLNEKEITNWFAQEEEFATSFYSFISRKNAVEGIQCLEEATVIKIAYNSLQELYRQFPETERVGRIITENYYIRLEERLLSLQFTSAKERYLNLLAVKPSIVKRAALGHIASYLGISQETLSRMRAEA